MVERHSIYTSIAISELRTPTLRPIPMPIEAAALLRETIEKERKRIMKKS
jgi:hypothetical protein